MLNRLLSEDLSCPDDDELAQSAEEESDVCSNLAQGGEEHLPLLAQDLRLPTVPSAKFSEPYSLKTLGVKFNSASDGFSERWIKVYTLANCPMVCTR